ncbi:MAG: LLM class F420-dependent oxidoreductase [Acidobacteria bacterium]|nr:LLM class F420-dependent oxidoreductase [Acidobacteriota bacterium]
MRFGEQVKIGVTIHATDTGADPVEVGVEAEARGFHSYYLPEHTHIPVSRETPAPTGDVELAEEYKRTPDPYVVLAAVASRTSEIRIGTGVGLVAQHDPIVLAKTIATLDRLSGGRFDAGIGYGWNREEMADHGVLYGQRRAVVRETMLAMEALWRNDVASYEGEHVRLSPSWAWPKPIQQPRPPVLIGGGAGPKLFAAIAEFADGWIPIGGAGLADAVASLRAAVRDVGRDPESLRVVPFGTLPDAGKLDYYRSVGVTEVVLRLPHADMATVLKTLDEYTRFL